MKAEEMYAIVKRKDLKYKQYTIPKRSGGYRHIVNPSDELKYLQREILDKILKHIPLDGSCHGFVDGKGIYTNAAKHVKSECIVNLDLKDFFPSCTKEMVIKVLSKYVRTPNAIAELITFNDCLPQGAPTSPYMANICATELDKKLKNLAYKHSARYTRYADDITFSSKTNKNLHKIIPKAHSFIIKQGFVLNYKKIKVYRRGGRMMVTGLVVNDKVNVPRPRLKNFRAEVHQADFSDGDFKEYARLMGFTSFIIGANKKKGVPLKEELRSKL